MNNPQMLAVVRVDHFNMKGSMCVIGLFGIITIVSYFNELNKAGLLRRGVIPRPLPHNTRHMRNERSVDHDTIIQKNGDFHQLGLKIVNLKQKVRSRGRTKGQEIDIKLHLGQNASYEKNDNSVVPIHNLKNTLPNFYTTLDLTAYNISAFNSSKLLSVRFNLSRAIQSRHKLYKRAVLVYTHQQELHGYLLRDCLKKISQHQGLTMNNLPINKHHRKQWEALSDHKRNSFQVLYGGQTFGVCDSINRPCGYFTLVAHPVDRLITIYDMCIKSPVNTSVKSMCKLNSADKEQQTLKQFVMNHGSRLFEKLMYYAKHCRLIGDDEICLQGPRTSFVFTAEEAEEHLKHILQHLETWFTAVGLVERLQDSLNVLQGIYGYSFSACYRHRESLYGSDSINMKAPQWLAALQQGATVKSGSHPQRRKALLRDKDIQRALYADLAIYKKMTEIFRKQMVVYHQLEQYGLHSQKIKHQITMGEKKDKLKGNIGGGKHKSENTRQRERIKVGNQKINPHNSSPKSGPHNSSTNAGPTKYNLKPGSHKPSPKPGSHNSSHNSGPKQSSPKPGSHHSSHNSGPKQSSPKPGSHISSHNSGPKQSSPKPGSHISSHNSGPKHSNPKPGSKNSNPKSAPQNSSPKSEAQNSRPKLGTKNSSPKPGAQNSNAKSGTKNTSTKAGAQSSSPKHDLQGFSKEPEDTESKKKIRSHGPLPRKEQNELDSKQSNKTVQRSPGSSDLQNKHQSSPVSGKNEKAGQLKDVEGLDPMEYQNLSALELSKFHAEGVRPGTLEKSNALHLRHLQDPALAAQRKLKRKQKLTRKKTS